MSVPVCLLVYAAGATSGFAQTGKACAAAAGRSASARPDSITEGAFPLSLACRWNDGTAVELVPGWINPALCTSMATIVFCSVLAVCTALKRKQEPGHE
ncbi:hypothetical protein [Streptomyces sp. NPDC127084]|uniref:hypothetical protein n=1 Tax=Streptomyces sp. NPDC127084 TaxID=3347133 RepID=UPI0036527E65